MASTDLSAIARYAHQFQKQLIATLVNGMDIAGDVMVMPGIKSSMKLPKLTVGDGFRPYSATTEFQTGDVAYTDRELKVDVGKREILIDPEAYRHKYLSLVLSAGSGANKMDIPFAQFLWEQVIKHVAREVNDEVAYYGFDKTDATAFDAGATYTAGDYITFTSGGVLHYYLCVTNTSAGESPATHAAKWRKVTARAVVPGIKSILDAEISGGGIVPVATGAVTNSSGVALGAFLTLFRAFTPAYKNYGVIIHCSYTDWEFLLDDITTKQAMYTMADVSRMLENEGMLPLPQTNRKAWVKPASWLGASRRLIAEPLASGSARGENVVMGTDLLADANEIKTIEDLWSLEAGIKFVLGFQIQDLNAIRIGNQA